MQGKSAGYLNHYQKERAIVHILRSSDRVAAGATAAARKPLPHMGADIDIDELVVTSMCEQYSFVHDPQAIELLQKTWVRCDFVQLVTFQQPLNIIQGDHIIQCIHACCLRFYQ